MGVDPGTTDRKNDLAKALIGLYVGPEYVQTVEDLGSAKDVWNYFKEMFKGKSHAWVAQLRLEFASIRQKPGEVVANYASRARDIYSDLKITGETPSENELVYNLVNGLRPEFGVIRTIILTGGEKELKLPDVLPMLQQEEDQQRAAGELTSEKETTVAYAAKGGKPFQKGFNKGSGNHGGNQGSNQGGKYNPKKDPCYECGKTGHRKWDCFVWHRKQREG